ncbi:MAG: Asp-tRNA(Asn)/Glu-tRNA(Gln) amidotransferase subunit GatB [archaeon]|nr:Asp-tRNA(Asn)/Glu-tRNA(Gln) amidotransferase subunit GatB [archaeon]
MKIGLEIHVQLPTKSKMFCSCPTTGTETVNTHICPGCLGLPGSRPSLNKKALELGLTIAKKLKCTIPETTWFSRKTYFYPDLCKHFQITQHDTPIGFDGVFYLGKKPIRIARVLLEEDPGKIKRVGNGSSLIDYNRSGIPLTEIVTEPDLSSPSEAREFLSELLTEIKSTIGLTDSGERNIRCDCNISVGSERCEVKNVTGLKNVETCLKYEAVRQTKLIKSGGKIERETRHFDEAKRVTTSARKKEFEADYGYIGEPDLGIYHVANMAKSIELCESPLIMIDRFQKEYGIDEKIAKQIVNTSIELAKLFEKIAKITDVDTAQTWIMGTISANWKSFEKNFEKYDDIVTIISKFYKGDTTDTQCNLELKTLMTGVSAEKAASISADLDTIINKIIEDNPSFLIDYRRNEKAFNWIVGIIMKQTRGKYSSENIISAAKKLIEERL